MKQIYMEQTLLAMAHLNAHLEQDDPNSITSLISSGTLKQTESGIRYLLIESKTEENEN